MFIFSSCPINCPGSKKLPGSVLAWVLRVIVLLCPTFCPFGFTVDEPGEFNLYTFAHNIRNIPIQLSGSVLDFVFQSFCQVDGKSFGVAFPHNPPSLPVFWDIQNNILRSFYYNIPCNILQDKKHAVWQGFPLQSGHRIGYNRFM